MVPGRWRDGGGLGGTNVQSGSAQGPCYIPTRSRTDRDGKRLHFEVCVDGVVRRNARKGVAGYCTLVYSVNDDALHIVPCIRGDRVGGAVPLVHRYRARWRDAAVNVGRGRNGIGIQGKGYADRVIRLDVGERVRGQRACRYPVNQNVGYAVPRIRHNGECSVTPGSDGQGTRRGDAAVWSGCGYQRWSHCTDGKCQSFYDFSVPGIISRCEPQISCYLYFNDWRVDSCRCEIV